MRHRLIFYFTFLLSVLSCSDFLDEKSDMKLAVPETVADNQALLDTYGFINFDFASSGDTSSDDYFLNDEDYDAMQSDQDRRLYTWQPDYVAKPATEGNDWQNCYRTIYICNTVLFNLADKKLTGSEADNVKGQALAIRAARYLDAAQIWCLAYKDETASSLPGLPLRLDPDMNIPSTRATLKETYNQIINDLHAAIQLLPKSQGTLTRISKHTAYGLLARTYLFMGDYENCISNATKALEISSKLIDYNTLDSNLEFPIPQFNVEISYWSTIKYESHQLSAKIPIDLYNSYSEGDLRKDIFFFKDTDNNIFFKGYNNNINGANPCIANDELYLMMAESYMKKNKVELGLTYLNELMSNRWKVGYFIPYSVDNSTLGIDLVMSERRKELLTRGLRWADLKRMNRDGANITLKRIVKGVTYTLPPNDLRCAIAIPEDVIALSGIKQNAR